MPLIPAATRQLIVATADSWNSSTVDVHRFERDGVTRAWRPVGQTVLGNAGHTGLAPGLGILPAARLGLSGQPEKAEGDNKTPAGIFRLGDVYGYEVADAPEVRANNFIRLTKDWKGVDDGRSRYYNRVVDTARVQVDWTSAEEMRRDDDLYSRVIVVGHNGAVPSLNDPEPTPGLGSCIFIHVWRSLNKPTAGCISLPFETMDAIAAWLDPAARPVIVILPIAEYRRLAKDEDNGLPLY